MTNVRRRETISLDDLHRCGWAADVDHFMKLSGWLDRGEQSALLRVAGAARHAPILDLGVGTGRTTALLRLLSDDYLGIDHTSEMIERCRELHPDADFAHLAAPDLSTLPEVHYALAFFGSNGIDAVSYEDRSIILREVRRVLRPEGWFVFRAHHLDGSSVDDRPWPLRPLIAESTPLAVDHGPRRLSDLIAENRQVADLETAGFEVHAVLDDRTGRPTSEVPETTGSRFLYYLARK